MSLQTFKFNTQLLYWSQLVSAVLQQPKIWNSVYLPYSQSLYKAQLPIMSAVPSVWCYAFYPAAYMTIYHAFPTLAFSPVREAGRTLKVMNTVCPLCCLSSPLILRYLPKFCYCISFFFKWDNNLLKGNINSTSTLPNIW